MVVVISYYFGIYTEEEYPIITTTIYLPPPWANVERPGITEY
jgi:hypothetical protein